MPNLNATIKKQVLVARFLLPELNQKPNLQKLSIALFVCTALLLSMSLSNNAIARDAAKGLEIAKEIKKRDEGWTDTSAETQMILRNPSGDESIREIRVKTLEIADDGDKSLTIFDQPRDVAGTAFLSFSKVSGPDDQWIYLPAVKRVKRIATRNKSSPFMGSEFAFEDMTSFEIEKFTFAYLRDETINGEDSYVIEQIPTDKYSGYSRQLVWIDKAHYRVQQVEFYDRKNSLLKILRPTEYQQYLGKYWRALRADMENVQTGKSTTLLTKDIEFKTGFDVSDFDKNALRRLR
jgi:outer membrane lipoprotein-sorting protein